MLYKLILLLIAIAGYAYIYYFFTAPQPPVQTKTHEEISSATEEKKIVKYVYTRRKEFEATWKDLSDKTNQKDLSWEFLTSVRTKLQNLEPEDKERLKEIQNNLKGLYIKYDHDVQAALKYDKAS